LAGGPYVDTAHACSCAGSWTYEEALRRSDAAFSGEVAGIGGLPPPEIESNDGGMAPFLAPVTFDVNEAWKGVQIELVVVYGQGPSASCGLDFERDDTYLVFAYHTGGRRRPAPGRLLREHGRGQ
jgi:hypothetical protein